MSGIKYDANKPRMDLLSTEALEQISLVLGFGASKYKVNNWRHGLQWSRVIGAAFRHLTAFNNGQDNDPETGLSHLAHLGCCVMFLIEYVKTHPELDDRYKLTNNTIIDKQATLTKTEAFRTLIDQLETTR